jgi:hypothetical protein
MAEVYCPYCGSGRSNLEERGRWGDVVLLYCPACDEEFSPVWSSGPPEWPVLEKPQKKQVPAKPLDAGKRLGVSSLKGVQS